MANNPNNQLLVKLKKNFSDRILCEKIYEHETEISSLICDFISDMFIKLSLMESFTDVVEVLL